MKHTIFVENLCRVSVERGNLHFPPERVTEVTVNPAQLTEIKACQNLKIRGWKTPDATKPAGAIEPAVIVSSGNPPEVPAPAPEEVAAPAPDPEATAGKGKKTGSKRNR